ncbi:MAG TPA: capsule biosynthesis protein [Nitrospinaceae bacterium]|jgi:hypothetical protein|nr:capsule biosynthesis protein [Nitrospinaceae bacterium]
MNIKAKFLEHPRDAGETYCEHLEYALKTVFKLSLLSLALVVHAFFPFLFQQTAGNGIVKLADEIEIRRNNSVQF